MKTTPATFKTLIFIVALLVLPGCTTITKTANIPPSSMSLLDFLQDGKTSKETALITLGQPSGTYEKERIITYRIGKDDKTGYYVMDRIGFWIGVRFSLVLVFDEKEKLTKHSLVEVR